jgi:predicted DNA-binding transcriptional regulator YafY
MKLYNSLRALILESSTTDIIIDAIRNKKVLVINYDGEEPGGNGLRYIEPVCFGYSKKNNPVLRAWDMEGASHRNVTGEKPLPSWRYFNINKIFSIQPTGENFTQMRPLYNPNGDKSMIKVVINAKFDQEV